MADHDVARRIHAADSLIALPSEAELDEPNIFFIHPANAKLVAGRGPGIFRFPIFRWLLALLCALFVAACVYLVIDEYPTHGIDIPSLILIVFAVASMVPIVMALTETLRRRRLVRKGRLIRGIGQCTSVEAQDEYEGYYYVSLQCVFVTSDGDTLQPKIRELTGDLPRWPKLNKRVPMALLYVEPQMYSVL